MDKSNGFQKDRGGCRVEHIHDRRGNDRMNTQNKDRRERTRGNPADRLLQGQ